MNYPGSVAYFNKGVNRPLLGPSRRYQVTDIDPYLLLLWLSLLSPRWELLASGLNLIE